MVQMSYPTTLGPWFVVQRLRYDDVDKILGQEFYQHADEGQELWTNNKKDACLFMSLQAASRIAEGVVGEVRVLTSKVHAEEFGRG
jgi:hypothetical protein